MSPWEVPLLRPLLDLVHSFQDCAFHCGPRGVRGLQPLRRGPSPSPWQGLRAHESEPAFSGSRRSDAHASRPGDLRSLALIPLPRPAKQPRGSVGGDSGLWALCPGWLFQHPTLCLNCADVGMAVVVLATGWTSAAVPPAATCVKFKSPGQRMAGKQHLKRRAIVHD